MPLLNPSEITSACKTVPAWRLDGLLVRRTFEFRDFHEAMLFVNGVADVAEEANHHPDIDIRWNKVTLALTTH
ncbi:MAG TPA: 4a-hydroxytetrahydrobiopterin dehydratase, partial [Candidatus Limnocylindria bacterium]|nr:4a-hydroxytetrahydrobiopterin dehydratase [Candidatus Limnocylindria bacterium]